MRDLLQGKGTSLEKMKKKDENIPELPGPGSMQGLPDEGPTLNGNFWTAGLENVAAPARSDAV